MSGEISQELVDRMVALVRECASPVRQSMDFDISDEARTIVALLPTPVDPDLIEAREMADTHSQLAGIKRFIPYAAGNNDQDGVVKALLAAIKHGRELAAKS